jgi:hypothetical protein
MTRRRRVLAVATLALALATRVVAQDDGDVDEEAGEAEPIQENAGAPPMVAPSMATPQPNFQGVQPPTMQATPGMPVTPPAATPPGASPGIQGSMPNAAPAGQPPVAPGNTPAATMPGMAVAPQTPPATVPAMPPPAAPPPGAHESPKRLGRQFPSPVNPPSPPETPEVHVTIIPPSEPRVTTDRLRKSRGGGEGLGGGQQGGGQLGGGDHPPAETDTGPAE